MFRLIVLLFAVLVAAFGPLPEAAPFRPSVTYPPSGPDHSVGAVVWVSGGVSLGQFTTSEYPDGQPAPA